MRNPDGARAATSARSSPRSGSARAGSRELARATAATPCAAAMDELARLLGAPRPRRRCARLPDGRVRGARTCSRRRRTADVELRVAVTIARRRARRSTSPAPRRSTTGNLNCPLAVTRLACLFVVRCLTDPDVPPSAGALRAASTVRAPEGCSSTRAARPRSPPATSRRRAASSTSSSRALRRRRVPVPGAGTGHDEQRRARERAASPTTRRSAAARARARTRTGRRASTSRCRTRSRTRRSRRSSSRYPLRVERYALRLGSGGGGRAPRRRRRRPRAARARAVPALAASRSGARIAPAGRAGGAPGARPRTS